MEIAVMNKSRVVLLIMIAATIACSIFGGSATEESPIDTLIPEATDTETPGMAQKEATINVPTQVEEPTSTTEPIETPKLTDTPEPTTQIEVPTPIPTFIAPDGFAYKEIVVPFEYVIENDADIEIVDFRVFRSIAGDDTYFGIMQNTGDSILGFPTIYVGAVDENDEVIEVEYAATYTTDIYPGERISFAGHWFDGFPLEEAEIVIAVEIRQETSEYYRRIHNYEVISSDVGSPTDGRHIISVRFRNISEYDTKSIGAEIVFWDSNNRIIGCGGSGVDTPTVVPPGGEADIDISVFNLLGDYESYEIIIEGWKAD
jgi:hypothetical protein